MINRKHKSGFTLIEVAVGVLIIGVFTLGIVALAKVEQASRAERITKERMEFIKIAFRDHVNRRGDLPCPALRDAAPGTPDFGMEVLHAALPADDPESTCKTFAAPGSTPEFVILGGATVEDRVYIGAVPTRTLNIASEYMVDGWGNRFTYAVTGAHTDGTLDEGQGDEFRILDNGNPPQAVTANDGSSIYVLVSHGPDGKGAWLGNGRSPIVPCGPENNDTDARDNFNCVDNKDFIATDKSLTTGRDYFDDIVDYATFIPDIGSNYCNRNLMFFAPDNPLADPQGCVAAGLIMNRWDYIKLPCTDTGGASAEITEGQNCSTKFFTKASAFTSNILLPGSGVSIFSTPTPLKAKDDGLLRIRATIPVVYKNQTGANRWFHAIMGHIYVNNLLIASGLMANPEANNNAQAGRTGVVAGIVPIQAGDTYTVDIRLVTLKNSAGVANAWAGTIKHTDYNVDGVVEIIEQVQR